VVSRCAAALVAAIALACSTPRENAPRQTESETEDARSEAPMMKARPGDGFLSPNAEDLDGTMAYIHYVREHMPVRVNVELPKLAARNASRDETDAGVIDAMREWETAIQRELPWFRLEIVRDDPDADIQVEWKTRITGDASGWGGIGWQMVGGRLRARGRLRYATKPCNHPICQLELPQLKLLVAHEFGHTLGLNHCLDCDSAMNYSWETLGRTVVTKTDVDTIRALYEIPNGTRVDGTLMIPLRGQARR